MINCGRKILSPAGSQSDEGAYREHKKGGDRIWRNQGKR